MSHSRQQISSWARDTLSVTQLQLILQNKCGNMYITRCRFGFPFKPSETTVINDVEKSLKSRGKIYQLAREEMETRVNSYNPLLLLIWKANLDVQFVAESSLALAQYVSGYVTKAERSNMQDIWEEVKENKNIYSTSSLELWNQKLTCQRMWTVRSE